MPELSKDLEQSPCRFRPCVVGHVACMFPGSFARVS